MKFAINFATLNQCNLEEFVKLCSKFGFQYLELRTEKIEEYLKEKSLEQLVKLIRNFNVDIISLNSVEGFTLIPHQNIGYFKEKIKPLFTLCSKINCKSIIFVASPNTFNLQRKEILKRTLNNLKSVYEYSANYGVKVLFEFIGFKNFSVRDLKTSIKILSILSSEMIKNYGLVIDTFHFFIGGSSLFDLRNIDISILDIVHINDVKLKSGLIEDFNNLSDFDRQIPFKGNFKLTDFFQVLRQKSFNKYVSIEVFNKKLWKSDPKDVLLQCKKCLEFFY